MTSAEIDPLELANEILLQPSTRAPRHSYAREFLLSLREKEQCKRLPRDFDASLLSEIEEAASHSLEWQHSRRSEYGSSSYARANNSRWETRSNASSDKDGSSVDGDSLSQDNGRRGVSQPRRIGQKPEKDGLLGSGSYPRASGFQGWSSSSKEPYQPPRPFKSGAHPRKDVTDTFNDETFGSSEFSDKNRQEEERIRRASFELMRQEQRKTLQQRSREEGDISSLTEKHDVEAKGDLVKSSRPLVPPGFSSVITETKVGEKVITENFAVVHDSQVAKEDSSSKKPGDLVSASGPFEFKDWGNFISEDSSEKKAVISEEPNLSGKPQDNSLYKWLLYGDPLPDKDMAVILESGNSQSSIFSSWFAEDSKKPTDDSSSKEILSMISKDANTHSSLNVEAAPIPTVLTCEDLEQSMLATVEDPHCLPLTESNPNFDLPKSEVDSHASEHLRSLLFKPKEAENVDPGKSLTLESLFGSAFMKELESIDAPISAQANIPLEETMASSLMSTSSTFSSSSIPQLPHEPYAHQRIPPMMHHHDHMQHIMANAAVHHHQHPGGLFQFQIPPHHVHAPLQYFPRAGTHPPNHATLHDGMHAFQGHHHPQRHHHTGYGMQVPGMPGMIPQQIGRPIELEIIQQQQQNPHPPSRFIPELSPDVRYR